MDNSEEYTNIAKRLEQLNQWQEEQKKILFERQDNQRKVLGLEHKKMYEMLGIYHQNTDMLKEKVMTDYASECETILSENNMEQTVDDEKENNQGNEQIDGAIRKRPFLRRKQGLMNRFKVDPDNFRLDKLPPYKFQSKHPSIQFQNVVRKKKVCAEQPRKAPQPEVITPKLSTPKKVDAVKACPSIDMLEQKFQKSLIFSKTVCNSTPDMKSQSSTKDTPEILSWATILDPHNVKPIEKKAFYATSLESQDKSDDTSIFELLEQKAKDGSFIMNSSFIRNFLNKNTPSEDDSVLEPYDQMLRPTPSEISQDATLRNSESSDEETDSEPESEEPKLKTKHHVRFVETPSVNMSTQNLSQTIDSSDASQAFEEFKKRIFENQSALGSMDASQCDAFVEDILQKADLIKARLGELELEIATFKQNNEELIKSKREHELEKAHFEQELKESRDKMNDERIQMEIYLHDERMKIEDERKEWDKKVRLQKSAVTAKERREATKLREQVEALQSELKKKEELHITSQSRLRSRIKTLEGNIRQLNTDITELQRENKRLEAESLQMNRQHSDKMLREINRNIAKLTPKGPWVLPSKTSPSATAVIPAAPVKQLTKQSPQRRISVQKQKSNLKTNAKPAPRPSTPTSSQDEDEDEESSSTSFGEHEFGKPKVVTFSKSPDREKSPVKDQENTLASVTSDNSFKREIVNTDGSKDIWYPNGNLKKISPDGMTIRMLYFNRDIKETNINEGTVKYYYAETNTWHTTYVDGLEILEFPNGQTEHRYKNGKVEVHFPNNSIKLTDPADEHKLEEWRFADGSNLIQMKNGDKILLLSNGQKEIHTALSKRREYPDGTVKLVYPDGSQETRYSNGRIRLKDKDGKLIMDTQTAC